jgi:hypothetical protein
MNRPMASISEGGEHLRAKLDWLGLMEAGN